MITAILIILWLGCCGVARRYQGAAKETWDWPRMPWRMLSAWGGVAALGVALGWWMGVPWYWWGLTVVPGLWAWTPGRVNRFWWQDHVVPKALWGPDGKWVEGMSGALGGLPVVIIFLLL